MNKVFLSGNVGVDPTITNFENGGKVAQFSLATTERAFRTKDGREIPETTDWHNIVIRQSGLAGVCEQHVKKGSRINIIGKIKTREYTDNAGQKRFITEIYVDELELAGGPKREQAPAPAPQYVPSGGTNDDMPL